MDHPVSHTGENLVSRSLHGTLLGLDILSSHNHISQSCKFSYAIFSFHCRRTSDTPSPIRLSPPPSPHFSWCPLCLSMCNARKIFALALRPRIQIKFWHLEIAKRGRFRGREGGGSGNSHGEKYITERLDQGRLPPATIRIWRPPNFWIFLTCLPLCHCHSHATDQYYHIRIHRKCNITIGYIHPIISTSHSILGWKR